MYKDCVPLVLIDDQRTVGDVIVSPRFDRYKGCVPLVAVITAS